MLHQAGESSASSGQKELMKTTVAPFFYPEANSFRIAIFHFLRNAAIKADNIFGGYEFLFSFLVPTIENIILNPSKRNIKIAVNMAWIFCLPFTNV